MTLEEKLKVYQEKIIQNPLTSVIITIALLLLLLIVVPYADISLRGINNATVEATLENQSRATLAQILGGVAIGIGLYYTWRRIGIAEKELKATQDNLKVAQDNLKVTQENLEATQKIAQENLKVAQEGQITERFTRAIDQLGTINQFGLPAIELRLGGIYALERIANGSDKDYWQIIEILTAYVRNNASIENSAVREQNKVRLDIQAVLTVIGRCKNPFNNEESKRLNLQGIYLKDAKFLSANLEKADFSDANLKRIDFSKSNLRKAKFEEATLEHFSVEDAILTEADFWQANIEAAIFWGSNLEHSCFEMATLEITNFCYANLREAKFKRANLKQADFGMSTKKANYVGDVTNLEGADFEMANLEKVNFSDANLKKVNFRGTDFKNVSLIGANLEGADFGVSTFIGDVTNLAGADFEMANLEETNLKGAKGLTFDQLSKAKTLYQAQLDEGLEAELRAKGFGHLLDDEPKDEP